MYEPAVSVSWHHPDPLDSVAVHDWPAPSETVTGAPGALSDKPAVATDTVTVNACPASGRAGDTEVIVVAVGSDFDSATTRLFFVSATYTSPARSTVTPPAAQGARTIAVACLLAPAKDVWPPFMACQ